MRGVILKADVIDALSGGRSSKPVLSCGGQDERAWKTVLQRFMVFAESPEYGPRQCHSGPTALCENSLRAAEHLVFQVGQALVDAAAGDHHGEARGGDKAEPEPLLVAGEGEA